MIITIDGPAGSGKSTIAQLLAKQLGFDYLDTGAHYRAVTYWFLDQKIDWTNPEQLKKGLDSFSFEIERAPDGEKRYFVNETDVTDEIRTPELAKHISDVSKIPEVRQVLTTWQRQYGEQHDFVVDGRDVGSVVFPHAACKFYLVANAKERAKRRYKELIEKGLIDPDKMGIEEVEKEILKRDHIDSTREVAPLVKPADAIEVDTSLLTIRQVSRQLIKSLKEVSIFPARLWKERLIGHGFRGAHFFVIGARIFTRFVTRLFYRMQIYGIESVPHGKALLTASHASFLDPPIIGAAVEEPLFYLAREPLFRVPLLGWLIHRMNALPVRGNVGDKTMFQQVVKIVAGGRKAVIFPEGERSLTNNILQFKRGAAVISFATGAPAVPIYIAGCYEVWKRGDWFPRLYGRIAVVFGKPLDPSLFEHLEGRKEKHHAFNEELRRRILALRKWYEEGAEGDIP